MEEHKLILASASPRRKELLGLFGIPFETRPAHVDETQYPAEEARDYVSRLARVKSEAIEAQPGEWVLSADTTVNLDGDVIGKPVDEAEAWQILRALRGRVHQVYTAISLRDAVSGQSWDGLCRTDVTMRAYSDDEIAAYIASGESLDKAGGYAIQDETFHPVAEIAGCYANVMGLPLCQLRGLLESAGWKVPINIQLTCPDHLGNPCTCYPAGGDKEPAALECKTNA